MKRCDSCDIELTGSALLMKGKPYCCRGCAEGGPCICTYEESAGRPATNGHVDPVLTGELFGRREEPHDEQS